MTPTRRCRRTWSRCFEQTLRDTQERLYDEFDWPFLKVQRDKVLAAGQRYYDVPTT
jgi:hypothetical protein